jgi:nucleoside-diphosphate-sugar epimerase
VDVRDVAKAHIVASDKVEITNNQRYLVGSGHTLWLKEIAAILAR